MKEFFAGIWKRFAKNQKGFTLAELIVVVAIIVGLAAVILPNIGRFTGAGEEGSNATEQSSVQAAIDAWAAEENVFPVPLPPGVDAVQLPLASTGSIDIAGFLRLPNGANTTNMYYCWNADGTITFATSTADDITGACN